jgi:hypothetical protein
MVLLALDGALERRVARAADEGFTDCTAGSVLVDGSGSDEVNDGNGATAGTSDGSGLTGGLVAGLLELAVVARCLAVWPLPADPERLIAPGRTTGPEP